MSEYIYELDGSRIQMMLQVEILERARWDLKKKKREKEKIITDLAASAFHRVISSETDKMTHLASLRSFT